MLRLHACLRLLDLFHLTSSFLFHLCVQVHEMNTASVSTLQLSQHATAQALCLSLNFMRTVFIESKQNTSQFLLLLLILRLSYLVSLGFRLYCLLSSQADSAVEDLKNPRILILSGRAVHYACFMGNGTCCRNCSERRARACSCFLP